MSKKIIFVLGGTASGKSAFAEKHALKHRKSKVYLATAQSLDAEMQANIRRHRQQRDSSWRTIEVPFDVTEVLKSVAANEVVLLDCLTMWLTNHLLTDSDLDAECNKLIHALSACKGQLIVVSNEVGQGIVPTNALARDFRNRQGRLNQRVAALADGVVFVTAGLPKVLKGEL